jgi:hypothetical protein
MMQGKPVWLSGRDGSHEFPPSNPPCHGQLIQESLSAGIYFAFTGRSSGGGLAGDRGRDVLGPRGDATAGGR